MTVEEKLARAQEIGKILQELFKDSARIDVETVCHRNEVLTGIGIMLHGVGQGPTIYYEDLTQDATLEVQAEEAAALLQMALKEMQERPRYQLPEFTRENILDKTVIQALSQANNRVLLEKNAHVKVLDLAAVFRMPVPSPAPETFLSTLIPRKVMEGCGLTPEEIYEAAQRNTLKTMGPHVIRMDKAWLMFGEGRRVPLKSADFSAGCGYMLTNRHVNGAGLMLIPWVLRQVRLKMGEDFYLVPTSIHEVILWKKSLRMDVQKMKKQLYKSNRKADVVDPKDVLTDSVYYYSGGEQRLRLV